MRSRILIALALLLTLTGCESTLSPPSRHTSTTPDLRLVITRYSNGFDNPAVWFIRDGDSTDCWIFVAGSTGAALQPASTTSCSRGERRGAARTDP